MASVAWSSRAVNDLSRLHHFLAGKNPRAAHAAMVAIRDAALELELFPAAGRAVGSHAPHLREWVVRYGESGYVIRYELQDERVTVAAIRHMREAGF